MKIQMYLPWDSSCAPLSERSYRDLKALPAGRAGASLHKTRSLASLFVNQFFSIILIDIDDG